MADDGSRFRLRSYQEEMLALSLRENIIVKVLILVLRVFEELTDDLSIDGHWVRQNSYVGLRLGH